MQNASITRYKQNTLKGLHEVYLPLILTEGTKTSKTVTEA